MRKSGETDSLKLDTLLEEKLRGTLPGVGGGTLLCKLDRYVWAPEIRQVVKRY